jgi:hypothetical protein
MSINPSKKRRARLRLAPKYIATPIKISLFITLFLLLLTGVMLAFIQPVIPLFYSLPNPSEQLVNKSWLLLLPALSFLINFIHLGLLKIFSGMDRLMVKLFAWSNLILQIILAIITLRNILIVFAI